MRKILLLILCCFTMCVTAQETKHMKFREIPMEGNINDFEEKLKEIGYNEVYRNDNGFTLTGQFAGKDAKIFLFGTRRTNVIYAISVVIEESRSWTLLKSEYLRYVDLFKQKYGKPTEHFEFFSKPYYEGDGYELQALKNGKCTYISYFDTLGGEIHVTVDTNCKIVFNYIDKINMQINKEERDKSVIDDI